MGNIQDKMWERYAKLPKRLQRVTDQVVRLGIHSRSAETLNKGNRWIESRKEEILKHTRIKKRGKKKT